MAFTDDLTIRPYRPGDEAAVVDVWLQCELVRPWNDPRKDIARKVAVQPEMFLVALIGGEVVGAVMAGYEGHRGWLNYLAVVPRCRGQGIGRSLVAEAERLLRAAGCPKINLQVRADNAAALAFYERIGFAVEDVASMGKRLVSDEGE